MLYENWTCHDYLKWFSDMEDRISVLEQPVPAAGAAAGAAAASAYEDVGHINFEWDLLEFYIERDFPDFDELFN